MSQLFNNGNSLNISGSCAQTSFLTLNLMLKGIFDFRTEYTSQALAQFSAIAMHGGTCGAVAGCIAAFGLIFSRKQEKFASWKDYLNSLSPAQTFCRNFEKQFGSTLCSDIMKSEYGKEYDLEDNHQASEWINNDATEKCGKVILGAVKIASEIILTR